MKKQIRIFVLDDDKELCDVFRTALEIEGYNVRTSLSASDTLSLLKQEKFHLVMIDLHLDNNKSGTDVCQAIRRDCELHRIPIIMMSANMRAKDICLKAGANRFIQKPFRLSYLYESVRQEIYSGLLKDKPVGMAVPG